MRTTSAPLSLFDMQSVFPLRHRSQGLLGGALVAPARGYQAHPGDAFHRANDVDAAADRPPAVARLLHEAEALEPLGKGRRVAAEAPAVQLESEQREPVLQPQQADEPSAPGDLPPFPAQFARRAPQGERIESGDDDAAF